MTVYQAYNNLAWTLRKGLAGRLISSNFWLTVKDAHSHPVSLASTSRSQASKHRNQHEHLRTLTDPSIAHLHSLMTAYEDKYSEQIVPQAIK